MSVPSLGVFVNDSCILDRGEILELLLALYDCKFSILAQIFLYCQYYLV